MENTRLYLYLVRRDKKGVKLLTVLSGPPAIPTRIGDVAALKLPQQVHDEVSGIVHEHRMEWEPWLQSAPDYHSLKEDLRKRGVTNVPTHSPPLYKDTSYRRPPSADTGNLPKRPVMAQKARKPS